MIIPIRNFSMADKEKSLHMYPVKDDWYTRNVTHLD